MRQTGGHQAGITAAIVTAAAAAAAACQQHIKSTQFCFFSKSLHVCFQAARLPCHQALLQHAVRDLGPGWAGHTHTSALLLPGGQAAAAIRKANLKADSFTSCSKAKCPPGRTRSSNIACCCCCCCCCSTLTLPRRRMRESALTGLASGTSASCSAALTSTWGSRTTHCCCCCRCCFFPAAAACKLWPLTPPATSSCS
ncbi:hypothetical protein COO60DRAFT_1118079 [Scenedesmus sp. NREL 46B-D3]|nr:hypothetical protein COO60DRAFT_1118079 [Scenedesmus sp. NREL 46B-D3]